MRGSLVGISAESLEESDYRRLIDAGLGPLVVDPVMIAKSGAPLLKPDGIAALKTKLLPLAEVTLVDRRSQKLIWRTTKSSASDRTILADDIMEQLKQDWRKSAIAY